MPYDPHRLPSTFYGYSSALRPSKIPVDALSNAWRDYPAAPPVVAPEPITDPGPTSPAPDPGSKRPPGWFWPVAGALAALGAWTAYQYFSPAPARDPLSGPGTVQPTIRCQRRGQHRRQRKIQVAPRMWII